MEGITISIHQKKIEYDSRAIRGVKQHTEYIDLHLDIAVKGQSGRLVVSQVAPADHNALIKSESPDYKVYFNGVPVRDSNNRQMAAFVQWCMEQPEDIKFEGKNLPVDIANWINAEFKNAKVIPVRDISKEYQTSELFCEGP